MKKKTSWKGALKKIIFSFFFFSPFFVGVYVDEKVHDN